MQSGCIWSYVLPSVALLLLGFYMAFLYVRMRYKEFCRREEQKERMDVLRREILSARDYARQFNTPMDHSISDNIIPKTEFLLKLISKKPFESQERELKLLRDMLTETFIRLNSRYDDVQGILAPLNSLRDRLVHEHLDWIKDHIEDGL